jgi:hypothetical protein
MKSDKNNIMIAVVSVTTLFESSDILNKCLIQVKKKINLLINTQGR